NSFLFKSSTDHQSLYFTYTTLFRSWRYLTMQVTLIKQMHQLQQAGYRFTRVQAHYALEELLPAAMDAHLDQLADTPAFVDRGQLDRKSTRLNSSHVSISYAVFCSKI